MVQVVVQAVVQAEVQLVGLAAVQTVVQAVDTEEPAVALVGYSKLQMTLKCMGFLLSEAFSPKQIAVSSSACHLSPSELAVSSCLV